MRRYVTEYWTNPAKQRGPVSATNAKYGSHLWARSMSDAEKIAKARGMGEKITGWGRGRVGEPLPSDMLAKRNATPQQKIETLHAITFLGYVALQSEAAEPWEIVGDNGILHEAIHLFEFGGRDRKRLVQMCRDIESRVPGFAPPVRRPTEGVRSDG